MRITAARESEQVSYVCDQQRALKIESALLSTTAGFRVVERERHSSGRLVNQINRAGRSKESQPLVSPSRFRRRCEPFVSPSRSRRRRPPLVSPSRSRLRPPPFVSPSSFPC
jgi:hypothetical protein